MNGEERRTEILKAIQSSSVPLSGTELARRFQVSRQIIVQDIAILRAANHEILSTNRGYLLTRSRAATRVFKVSHSDEQILDELNTIVDLGGRVIDVFVNHKVYGQIKADLFVRSRRDALAFLEGIHSGKSSPLKNLTSSYHYHTIEADSEEVLDLIEDILKVKGYLIV